MRRFDKDKHITNANLLIEQRYINEREDERFILATPDEIKSRANGISDHSIYIVI